MVALLDNIVCMCASMMSYISWMEGFDKIGLKYRVIKLFISKVEWVKIYFTTLKDYKLSRKFKKYSALDDPVLKQFEKILAHLQHPVFSFQFWKRVMTCYINFLKAYFHILEYFAKNTHHLYWWSWEFMIKRKRSNDILLLSKLYLWGYPLLFVAEVL